MKTLFLGLTLLSTISAWANNNKELFEKMPGCQQSIEIGQDWMAVAHSYKSINLAHLHDNQRKLSISLNDAILDLYLEKDILYVLTINSVEIFDLSLQKKIDQFKTLPGAQIPFKAFEGPKGFAFNDGKIYIAHGRKGITVLDKSSGRLLSTIQVPGEANDIYFHHKEGWILSDSVFYHDKILVGLYQFDADQEIITNQTHLDGAPTGDLFVDDRNIFVGKRFHWQLIKKKVLKKNYLARYKSVFFPTGMASGKPFRDQENLYYCQGPHLVPKVVIRNTIER